MRITQIRNPQSKIRNDFLLPALACLAFLALNDLGAVLDALSLVWLRFLQASQVCSDLPHELLIHSLERDLGLLGVYGRLDPLGHGIDDRVRKSKTQHQICTLRR